MKIFEAKTSIVADAQETKLSPGPLKIREAAFEDYRAIAALQIRNSLSTKPYHEWAALWRGNPAYEQRDAEYPIGWVLEAESGNIVGSISNIPLAYHFKGRELRAATSCSWVVDTPYRSYSMALMSTFMRQKGVDLFVCTTVSPAAEASYQCGFQFSRAPAGTWNKSEFWITNYRGFSQSALAMKSVPLAKVVRYPVAATLYCWNQFRDGWPQVNGAASEVELCSGFDSRFDDFWEELKRQKDGTLLAVRTRETLAWHFGNSLARQNVWIRGACRGSRLVAYAIFDRLDNPGLGLKRVRLVDFQALRGYEDELGSALNWMLQKCRDEGSHVLESAGCWLGRTGLRQIHPPCQRTLSSWMYYYKAVDKDLDTKLKDPAAWAPSSFDGDASL